MKPRVLCAACQAELQVTDKFCPNCGTKVEWSTEAAPAASAKVASVEPERVAPTSPNTFMCLHCGAANRADATTCESCGALLRQGVASTGSGVDSNQRGDARRPQSTSKEKKGMSKKAESTPDTSWKMIAGFAGFLIVGVVAMELLTRKEPTAQVEAHDHDLDHPTDAANMQALPQIEELEKRIAADPKDVKLVLQLANLLQDAKFYDKAIQNYKTYLAQMPNDPDALVDLGICYYDIGQYAEATSYMMKALQVDPKHVLGHFNLGIVALRQGKMKEANEWFRKTIELAPESPAGRQAKQFIEQHPAS